MSAALEHEADDAWAAARPLRLIVPAAAAPPPETVAVSSVFALGDVARWRAVLMAPPAAAAAVLEAPPAPCAAAAPAALHWRAAARPKPISAVDHVAADLQVPARRRAPKAPAPEPFNARRFCRDLDQLMKRASR